MDNRKRQRLEVTPNVSMPISNVASTTTQSFFLSTNPNDCSLSTNNVLLTICTDDEDVHSDESHEYLAIDETLTGIKEEDTRTSSSLPVQYRIMNPTTTTTESIHTNASTVIANASAMLPTSLQLPSGCDIYLVKEYVNPSNVVSCMSAGTTIKLENNERATSSSGGSGLQIVRSVPCVMPKGVFNNVTSTVTPTAPVADSVATAESGISAGTVPLNKRSYILETYKKRDDKRRATHNEVERRRRDKINSWIFKLKEMLPEMPTSTVDSASKSTATASVSTTAAQDARSNTVNNNGNCRTPPSDSKSQILIKACEYIKTMQEEIKSLRECLTENENLRLSNQRLQCELEKYKNECQSRNANNSNNNNNNSNNSYNITLSNLNSNGLFSTTTPTVGGGYTKRELIIRDYVD